MEAGAEDKLLNFMVRHAFGASFPGAPAVSAAIRSGIAMFCGVLCGAERLSGGVLGGRSPLIKNHAIFLPSEVYSVSKVSLIRRPFSLLFLCSLLFSPFYQTLSDTAQRATVNRIDHLFNLHMFSVLYNSLILFHFRQQATNSNQQHKPSGCAKR